MTMISNFKYKWPPGPKECMKDYHKCQIRHYQRQYKYEIDQVRLAMLKQIHTWGDLYLKLDIILVKNFQNSF